MDGNPAEKSKMLKELFLIEANAIVGQNNSELKYSLDSSNTELIDALCQYFTGNLADGLLPTKGILITGEVGVGKSVILKAFANALKHWGKSYRFVNCADVVLEYENTGILTRYMGNEAGYSGKPAKFCFDELGRETMPALHYGNKRNVLQHILAYRYNHWQSFGLITHATTNASPMELVSLYGEHIADRIKEMFNTIVMTGESRR